MDTKNSIRNDLLRKRTGKKISITKRVNQINSMIENNGNKELIEHLCVDLKRVLGEAEVAHEEYLKSCDDENEELSDEWLIELSMAVDNCICRVQTYKCIGMQNIGSKHGSEGYRANPSIANSQDGIKCYSDGAMSCYEKVSKWQNENVINLFQRRQDHTINVTELDTSFVWIGHAQEVYVTGSFDNWSEKRKMTFINGKHQTQIALKRGSYEFKFIVDGKWRHDPCLEKVSDGHGGYNNTIMVAGNLDNFTSYAASAVHSEIHHNDTNPREKTDIKKEGMWNQLKKIAIPTFSGNIRDYENWKATFTACIDDAPASAEYKLLQLRQYLSGDALRVIDGLGHSKTAYNVAKERLERKYGGNRRRTALYLEEVDQFKTVRINNADDLERFADLLDLLTINLKESDRMDELGNGLLYIKLQQKLPSSMIAQYYKWIHENRHETNNVSTLREWIILESEFQCIAKETSKGLLPKTNVEQTYLTDTNSNNKRCAICNKVHEKMNVKNSKGWMSAKDGILPGRSDYAFVA